MEETHPRSNCWTQYQELLHHCNWLPNKYPKSRMGGLWRHFVGGLGLGVTVDGGHLGRAVHDVETIENPLAGSAGSGRES